jgi:amino acid transporter
VKFFRYLKIGIPVLLVILLALFLHKNLIRTEVVQVSGTDVRRTDESKSAAERVKNKSATSDIRFINTLSGKGKVMVFRNEDTGWGWPPYFKFNSADLAAEAQAFSNQDPKPWVLVKYYGWRIQMFSMFPNALSLKEVQKGYSHFPLFNIIVISILILLAFLARRKVNKLFDWARGRKKGTG